MATQSSILTWKIPWTGEPGGLQSMGSQRVRDELTAGRERNTICVCTEVKRSESHSVESDSS